MVSYSALVIALGSAVKTASMLNVDNRIMYRAGVVARETGLIDADYVMGIPLSASGKSIYFDRKAMGGQERWAVGSREASHYSVLAPLPAVEGRVSYNCIALPWYCFAEVGKTG